MSRAKSEPGEIKKERVKKAHNKKWLTCSKFCLDNTFNITSFIQKNGEGDEERTFQGFFSTSPKSKKWLDLPKRGEVMMRRWRLQKEVTLTGAMHRLLKEIWKGEGGCSTSHFYIRVHCTPCARYRPFFFLLARAVPSHLAVLDNFVFKRGGNFLSRFLTGDSLYIPSII